MTSLRMKPSKWARTLREHCATPETWDWAKHAGKSYPKAWKALGENVHIRADILGALADDALREAYASNLLVVWERQISGRSYGAWFIDARRRGFTPRQRAKIERELGKLLLVAKTGAQQKHAPTYAVEHYQRLQALEAFVRLLYCRHWLTWGRLLQKMWECLPWNDRPKFRDALETLGRPALPR
jgi:hypothetical protein